MVARRLALRARGTHQFSVPGVTHLHLHVSRQLVNESFVTASRVMMRRQVNGVLGATGTAKRDDELF